MIAKKMIEEQWQTTTNKKSITATFANFVHLKLFQKPKEKKLQLSLPEARRKKARKSIVIAKILKDPYLFLDKISKSRPSSIAADQKFNSKSGRVPN